MGRSNRVFAEAIKPRVSDDAARVREIQWDPLFERASNALDKTIHHDEAPPGDKGIPNNNP